MIAKRQLLLSLSLITLLFSCGDETDFVPSWDNFGENYIKTGAYCGKCIGVCIDTLVITPSKIFYKPTTFGNGDPQSALLEKPYTEAEFRNLLQTVDPKAFNALNENSCDRCFDGCDTWYDLKAGEFDNSVVLSASTTNTVLSQFEKDVIEIKASFQ